MFSNPSIPMPDQTKQITEALTPFDLYDILLALHTFAESNNQSGEWQNIVWALHEALCYTRALEENILWDRHRATGKKLITLTATDEEPKQ